MKKLRSIATGRFIRKNFILQTISKVETEFHVSPENCSNLKHYDRSATLQIMLRLSCSKQMKGHQKCESYRQAMLR